MPRAAFLRRAGPELPDLFLLLDDPGREGCERHIDLLAGKR
jgi:hypothetical protein